MLHLNKTAGAQKNKLELGTKNVEGEDKRMGRGDGRHAREGENCSKCRVAPSISIETERREGMSDLPINVTLARARPLGFHANRFPGKSARWEREGGRAIELHSCAISRDFFQPPSKMNSDPITKVSELYPGRLVPRSRMESDFRLRIKTGKWSNSEGISNK